MKKIVLFLLLLFTPLFVFAKDTCNPSNIKIESITLEDTKGNIEEVKEASSSGQKINLGLRMNVVGDTASYKIVLKNTSNEDYYFDEKSLNLDTDYVDYTISYEDDNNLIKSGEEKILFLKVVYKEKMDSSTLENGLYQDTQIVKLNLTNNNLVDEILENPITGSRFGIIVFIILIISFLLYYKEKKKSAYLFLLCLIIPFGVQALCRHSLEIENDLTIDTKEAIFLSGGEVNIVMKELAGDDTSSEKYPIGFNDTKILAIKKSDLEPDSTNKEEKNIVSTPESEYPIYMWYDNGVIYWWSEDETPALNSYSGSMFNKCSKLSDISGLKSWDTSNVTSFDFIFNITSITNLTSLSNWNTSMATGMSGIFGSNKVLQSLSGIENWDTSSATSMAYLLYETPLISSIQELKNWDVSNVTNMAYMFYNKSVLTSIDGLEKWNTSNLKFMPGMFSKLINVEEIDISSFDTKKVTDFKTLFDGSNKLKHIYVGKNWDISANTDESTRVFPTQSELPNFSTTNENFRNLSYAHTGEGGYLTLKIN